MLIKEKITLKAPRADYYTGLSYHKETTAGEKRKAERTQTRAAWMDDNRKSFILLLAFVFSPVPKGC